MKRPITLHRYAQRFSAVERSQPLTSWPTEGAGYWEDRACGLACIRTVMRHYGLDVPSQHELLLRGLEIGAYGEGGWVHAGLVRLAAAYDLAGFGCVVSDLEAADALAAIGVPAILSCTLRFPVDGRRGGHLVVFAGFRRGPSGDVACFADPSRWGRQNRSVAASRFWASCTGRAITLWPGTWKSLPLSRKDRTRFHDVAPQPVWW